MAACGVVSANEFYYGLWSMVDCYKGKGQSQRERGFFMCIVCPVGVDSLRTSISYFLVKEFSSILKKKKKNDDLIMMQHCEN